jgi:SAM-dependent methyltransferase
MNRPASLNFDRVADRYDESRGGTARGERIAADVVPWLAPGVVLEIGVGTGLIAAALRARGVPVYGLDLSPEMLRRAVDRIGPAVARADARALPIASGSMDNVLFVAALHAIGDVAGAIAEAARVLRPGGRVVAVFGPRQHDPSDDVARALMPLTGLRGFRTDIAPALDAATATVALEPVGTAQVTPDISTHAPAEVADGIEQRLWSYLWDVDESTWDSVVAPVVATLRALPEPDRPRQFAVSAHIAVFARA